MTSYNNALEPRTGFNIGSDFAFYGLTPNTSNDDISAGFTSATFNVHTRKRTNKFLRKWLTLRLHAFERGIHFSEDVTVFFLENLLAQTNGFCPFTGVRLTSGTLTDNDWSIDRVCNQFGYIPMNMAVMTRALNEKKSNMTALEIGRIVDDGEIYDGFKVDAWQIIHDDMIMIEYLFSNIEGVSKDINAILSEEKSTLLSLLQIILIEDDPTKRVRVLEVLLLTVGGDKALENKMKKMVRALIIKNGKTKETNLEIILTRSASLARQVDTLSKGIDISQLQLHTDRRATDVARYANEALWTTKQTQ